MNQKYEELKTAIVACIPSIMELKFGCEVKVFVDGEGFENEGSLEYSKANMAYGYVTNDEYLQIDTNVAGDILVRNIVEGYLGEDYEGVYCEILGRPITAQDIQKVLPHHWMMKWDTGLKRYEFVLMEDYGKKSFKNRYIPFEDKPLDQQQESVINSLHSLLVTKN